MESVSEEQRDDHPRMGLYEALGPNKVVLLPGRVVGQVREQSEAIAEWLRDESPVGGYRLSSFMSDVGLPEKACLSDGSSLKSVDHALISFLSVLIGRWHLDYVLYEPERSEGDDGSSLRQYVRCQPWIGCFCDDPKGGTPVYFQSGAELGPRQLEGCLPDILSFPVTEEAVLPLRVVICGRLLYTLLRAVGDRPKWGEGPFWTEACIFSKWSFAAKRLLAGEEHPKSTWG